MYVSFICKPFKELVTYCSTMTVHCCVYQTSRWNVLAIQYLWAYSKQKQHSDSQPAEFVRVIPYISDSIIPLLSPARQIWTTCHYPSRLIWTHNVDFPKRERAKKGWRWGLSGLKHAGRDPFHVAEREGLVHRLAMSTVILRVWRRGEGRVKKRRWPGMKWLHQSRRGSKLSSDIFHPATDVLFNWRVKTLDMLPWWYALTVQPN